MDRFNSNRIFERLREINTLANIQLSKDGKPPLRFFYLLRDDIFISKDRTKFFDYIVPIVPVVDSSNSYDQFIAHLKDGGILDLFDEGFLQGLSLYVDDMRILKNIYNEFVVYFNRLNTTDLSRNKMLGMIAYKNVFPRDFSDLQLNNGYVYTLLGLKNRLIDDEVSRLNQEADELKTQIDYAKKEHLTSVQELNDAYKARLSRTPASYGTPRNQYVAELNEWYANIFPRRKQAIEANSENRLADLEEELSALKKMIDIAQSKKFAELLTRDNIDSFFKSIAAINEIGEQNEFLEIKKSDYFPLLKFLIRNGHIDETYADYMTYFYENSLSRIDKVFLRSVTDKKARDFTYQLKKPQLVASRLNLTDFDQEEILNFDLFEYLLQTPEHEKYTDRFMQQLKSTKNFKFIGAFFDTERELSRFVKALNSSWTGIFLYALKKKSLTDQQLRLYSIYSLYYSSFSEIKAMDEDECLTQYISNSPDYLDIAEPNINKLIDGFKTLGVSFAEIDSANANEGLLKAVYENSLYQINFANITMMLNAFYSATDEESIQHQNYTLVLSQPTSPLSKYLSNNISEYIEIVLDNSDGEINDTESVAISVLNNETITDEQKTAYIEQLTITITSISKVDNTDLWEALLSNRIAAYSTENVFEYFGDGTELDVTLIDFIDSCEEKLDFSSAKNQYGDEKSKNLFSAILKGNNLSDKKYREILPTLDFFYESFAMKGLSDSKFKIIVDLNIPRMTAGSLTFIREHYSSQHLYFIACKVQLYADLMTAELFVLSELETILSWDIADNIKIKLLGFTDAAISAIGLKCSPAIKAHILNNNLESNDLPGLFASYDDWTDNVKEIIFKQAIGAVTEITADPDDASASLLKQLLASSSLNAGQKIDLFAASISKFSQEECEEIFDILELPSTYKNIYDRNKRPGFEINSTSTKLLSAFAKEKIIYEFEEDSNRSGYYKIRRTKPIPKILPIELL